MPLPRILSGSFTVLLLASPSVAWADGEVVLAAIETNRTEFVPADFAQYSPVTALDMVSRIPGFAIQSDDSGNRGFGQARGNVLIDGQRVSSKSNGAEAALGRIAPARVVRIEVLDGNQTDIPGLSGMVVNVVTDGKGTLDGSWRWKSRIRENLPPSFDELNLTLSGADGALSWTFEADSSPGRGANAGWRDIRDGAGAIIERRDEDMTIVEDNVTLSGSLAWKPVSGTVANLTASAASSEFNQKQISKTFPAGGPEGRRFFFSSEDEWNGELGGDIEFDAGPGRLKFIGLSRYEHSPFSDYFSQGNLDGTNAFEQRFLQTVDEGEQILRSEYALSTGKGRDWQVSIEGAFNFLEAETSLLEAAGGGPLTEVPLDLSNSRVEERRAEMIFTHGRQLTPKLSLQVSAGAEYSELSQTGDAENKRAFTRPKGQASLSWQQSDTLKLVTKVERRVGQLDFFDFISSVNIEQDIGSGGNPEIVPNQSWRLNLEAQKDFKAWGATTTRLIFVELEDVVDEVPIGTGSGPGNIDTGSLFGIETESTLKLSKLGFTGAELTFNGSYYDTEVEDPLTGTQRSINYHTIYDYSVELRQDIPGTDWAWGAEIEGYKSEPGYQLNQVSLNSNEPAFALAYVQNKDVAGMTATFTLGNLFNQRDKTWRAVYAPDRNGTLVRSEKFARGFGPIVTFELKGTF
ncbi:TonB-dependent receptor plug domain-containing protein [Hyphomonas sp.]|uniref:TonB-dependent receptor plug domain-containing protein n=1 Tax=Hyphomonas sp. TaxID=87 RepID=UPI00391C8505